MRKTILLVMAGCILAGSTVLCAQDSTAAKKSVVKAFIFSLVMPGTGEYYLGHKKTAAFFWTAEAGLWLSSLGFYLYSTWRLEDSRAYAAQYAGIDLAKVENNENFLKALGDYQNLDEYNHTQELNGTADQIFAKDQGYNWDWPGDTQRNRYVVIRRSGLSANQRIYFVSGAILFNHLVSALNTIRTVKSEQKLKTIREKVGLRYIPQEDLLLVTLQKEF